MVHQRSWRYVIAQIVVNIPFVTVSEKFPSFEICFISMIVFNKPCPAKSIEKPEKGETTGKIVFIWNYTIVTKMQLIKVSILLFSLICGIFMYAINCIDINYIKLIMKCNN